MSSQSLRLKPQNTKSVHPLPQVNASYDHFLQRQQTESNFMESHSVTLVEPSNSLQQSMNPQNEEEKGTNTLTEDLLCARHNTGCSARISPHNDMTRYSTTTLWYRHGNCGAKRFYIFVLFQVTFLISMVGSKTLRAFLGKKWSSLGWDMKENGYDGYDRWWDNTG